MTFDEIDADDDNAVTTAEFGDFDAEFGTEGFADNAFDLFDDDASGDLDAGEYEEESVDRFGSEVGFDEIDTDPLDGAIDEEEFGVFEDEFGFGV